MLVNLGLQHAEFVQGILASPIVQASFTPLIKFILARYLHSHNQQHHTTHMFGAYNQYPHDSTANPSGDEIGAGPNQYSRTSGATDEQVLNWAIRSIGLYTHNHAENQDSMNWGEPPTIISLLVKSCPFRYFSNPRLQAILFPTLIAMCNNNAVNTRILSEAVNPKSLAGFIRSHIYANNNPNGGGGDDAAQERGLLATTCAVLMTDVDWRKAEEYFDSFQEKHTQQQQDDAESKS